MTTDRATYGMRDANWSAGRAILQEVARISRVNGIASDKGVVYVTDHCMAGSGLDLTMTDGSVIHVEVSVR